MKVRRRDGSAWVTEDNRQIMYCEAVRGTSILQPAVRLVVLRMSQIPTAALSVFVVLRPGLSKQ